MTHNNNLVLSIALFAVVTALDIITTIFALSIGAHEANPIMYSIVSVPEYFLLVKLSAIGVIAYLGWNIEQKMEGMGVVALSLAAAVTVLVVHNNFQIITSLI